MDLNYLQKLNDKTIDLVENLRLKKKKIICIESCTGGLLSSSITSFFAQSIILKANGE